MNIAIFITVLVLFLSFAPQAHALVILPALILIPLAKVLAALVAAFSLPAASVGVLLGKNSQKKKNIIIFPLIAILVLVLIAAVVLKLTHPNNPWF